MIAFHYRTAATSEGFAAAVDAMAAAIQAAGYRRVETREVER